MSARAGLLEEAAEAAVQPTALNDVPWDIEEELDAFPNDGIHAVREAVYNEVFDHVEFAFYGSRSEDVLHQCASAAREGDLG